MVEEEEINTAENLKELVNIVDENNNIIGSALRKEMREKVLRHQATTIFVMNSENKFYVHLRHKDKKYKGNHYTTAFGGCLGVGETYD